MNRQCKRIIDYIEDYGSITPIEALQDLGVMRLAARVHDIASKYGYPIKRETVKSRNRYGETIHYTKYSKAV